MRVLVTGASTGIGAATALVLTARGHEVVATARRIEALDHLDVAQRLPLDVCDDQSVAACVAAAGDIDVLVNNAGITETGPLESYPHAALQRMFETNVFGPMRMIRALVPAMHERGHGVVVNVSSVEGRVAAPLAGAYCGTKHALEALSESLALEVGHFGVRVVIIEPGYIAPGMRNAVRHGEDGTAYEELRRQWSGSDDTLVGPDGRPAPELVGEAIAEAIADPATPLRVPVGADAELVLATRSQQDDATFHATMRQVLGLTW
ncbi:MAG: short-chain dehydrogenase/reductase [Acidimicrobiales bacterium]|nr:short-chain dehydrogenase/reductase [Acidimicrobiales bacterium]